MKRSLFPALLFCLGFLSLSANADERNAYGLGVTYESGIYQGQDGYTEPYPFIDANFGDFFIKDKVVGWTGFRHNNISIALIASYNDYFLDTEDINDASKDIFVGIENRDRAFEIGFLYTYYSQVGDLTWEYYKDVSDKHGGMHNIVRLARPTGNPNLITFTPSIYVHYFSSAFNDYYYGISASENVNGFEELKNRAVDPRPDLTQRQFDEFRPEFEGENSGHLGFDIVIKKPYSQNIVGVFYAAWEEVLAETENSSLVEDSERLRFRLGLEYKF
ncbi:MAG: MipA/OmpV family protein [Oleiphilaceae bacterium]|uniref:MipA/OmpV family protein n=1 Tax=Oleiphilus sp. HI0125 TaxID=1822266 RepID=UPI0007C3B2BD|nr:MipA/OmpV family protein [Oleiphilus sp. HI0125]KZZ59783.1 hypothetical protein A3762_04275 [Oleiphilus sp. HI0125]MCH2159493.1 MipA/OmpV family protein [Oleiphilaceae bacterium]